MRRYAPLFPNCISGLLNCRIVGLSIFLIRGCILFSVVTGIARASGAETCQLYATGYSCKGSMATREWNKVFNRIARAYVNYNLQQDTGSDAAPGTSTTSLKRVMYSFMREISKGRDVPKDEACFLLAGGKLHQNSADTFKCSDFCKPRGSCRDPRSQHYWARNRQ